MSINEKTLTTPYFDDYSEDAMYQAILFRPGRTVQARELNQISSILRTNMKRLASGLYDHGYIIQGNGVSIKQKQYLKVTYTGSTSTGSIAAYDDYTLYVKNNSGLTAIVDVLTQADDTDPTTMHVSYIDSGYNGIETEFGVGDTLIISTTIDSESVDIGTCSISETGYGTIAVSGENIMMIDDTFCKIEKFAIPATKYSLEETARVGVTIVESIVTAEEDDTLYSNATGEPNYKSEGADRFKTELVPTIINDLITEDENFIEIVRVTDGVGVEKVKRIDLSDLKSEIARSIYEESGNYSVEPFEGFLREHLDDGTNDGLLTAEDGGDSSKFVLTLKGGLGYVHGYRVENTIENIEIEKARDYTEVNNHSIPSVYGNYILVNNLYSAPVLDLEKPLDLYDSTHAGSGAMGSGNVIGTCNVRYIQNNDSTTLKMFIFNVVMNTGKTFSNVKGIRYSDSNNLFAGDVINSFINDSANNTLLFDVGVDATKTLKPGGSTDTTYTVMKEYNATTDTNGMVTIVAGTGSYFDSFDFTNYIGSVTGGANDGTIFNLTGKVTLSGSPVGQSISIDLTSAYASTDIKIIAPVIKSEPVEKTKTLTQHTETVVFTNESSVSLSKVDVFSLTSVIRSGDIVDATDLFTIDSGMRNSFYDVGSISTADGLPITGEYVVVYEYFESTQGDYFSVDSYSGMDYEDIPTYTSAEGVSYDLRDTIDFRPYKNNYGTFVGVSGNGDIVKPNDTIRADIQYYLPRIDLIYVTKDGEFGNVKGVPGLSPSAPAMIENAMMLYSITIPAYTLATEDISMLYVDNRRYTMKDIGAIQKRVETLEHVTVLNQMESTLNNTTEFDQDTGIAKFKNGFIADGFKDYSVIDTDSAEFSASLDIDNGILKPNFEDFGVDLTVSNLSNATKNGLKILNEYTTKESTVQSYATKSVNINPNSTFSYNGNIALTPERDFWRDRRETPPIIINKVGTTSTILKAWGDWAAAKPIISTTSSESGSVSVKNNLTSMDESTKVFDSTKTYSIEHMREKEIEFVGTGFKPSTILTPTFDGKNVSTNCKPETGDYGDTLVTDDNGYVKGFFNIPNTNSTRFKVGEAVFVLTDASGDHGKARFKAKVDGLGIGSTDNTITPRSAGIDRSYGDKIVSVDDNNRWKDPVAQTFTINSTGGEFITDFSLYFKTKDDKYPVTAEIVKCQSGVPTKTSVPGAMATVNTANVETSTDASVGTTFSFTEPVFLKDNTEYAIVINANSTDYTLFVADTGDIDLTTGNTASKQPNVGSYYTSKGDSVWTVVSNTTIKFSLNRAVFSVGSTATIEFDCSSPTDHPCSFNAITTETGSYDVVIKNKNHGLKIGDTFIISGANGGNGIDDTDINKTHIVKDYTQNTITTTVNSEATDTGTIGGNGIRIIHNYQYSLFHAIMDTMQFNSTNVKWYYKTKLQYDRSNTSWVEFVPNETVSLDDEAVVISSGDFAMKAEISTSVDNLSTVIDLDGSVVALIGPMLGIESEGSFSYVSKTISFSNISTMLKLYIYSKIHYNNDMKIYYKLISDSSENINALPWIEFENDAGNVVKSEDFVEQTYTLENSSFIGVRFKIALSGDDRINFPQIKQVGSIAFI